MKNLQEWYECQISNAISGKIDNLKHLGKNSLEEDDVTLIKLVTVLLVPALRSHSQPYYPLATNLD
jgi:hypothetical protein